MNFDVDRDDWLHVRDIDSGLRSALSSMSSHERCIACQLQRACNSARATGMNLHNGYPSGDFECTCLRSHL